jgi:hypothetical protein
MAWAPALVAGGFALLVSVATAVFAYAGQRRLADATAAANRVRDQRLAHLERETAQETALRAYEYEARKRLYAEVRPLLFQLRESCPPAADRLRRILRGDIVMTLGQFGTTAQRIFAPLVIAREIQRKLTAVDLALDPALRSQYVVARELTVNLHNGRALAATVPELPGYLAERGATGRRQHLTYAELDRLVDFLTVREPDGSGRPMRQAEVDDVAGADDRPLRAFESLFGDAGPAGTPVLWRLLLSQAVLLGVLVDLVDRNAGSPRAVLPADIDRYGWPGGPGTPDFAAEKQAVERYVWERLRELSLLA